MKPKIKHKCKGCANRREWGTNEDVCTCLNKLAGIAYRFCKGFYFKERDEENGKENESRSD